MKTLSCLLIILLLYLSGPLALAEDAETHYNAFKRTVERLKNEDTASAVAYGAGGIKVTCTILPQGKFTALAWEIDNPNKRAIDVMPDGIRLYDQVREIGTISPAEADRLLYGVATPSSWSPLPSPFVTTNTPPEILTPPLRRETQTEKDIIESAFDFIKTDSTLITGLTYHESYGRNERPLVEITVNGETLKFQFERN